MPGIKVHPGALPREIEECSRDSGKPDGAWKRAGRYGLPRLPRMWVGFRKARRIPARVPTPNLGTVRWRPESPPPWRTQSEIMVKTSARVVATPTMTRHRYWDSAPSRIISSLTGVTGYCRRMCSRASRTSPASGPFKTPWSTGQKRRCRARCQLPVERRSIAAPQRGGGQGLVFLVAETLL